MSGKSTGGGGKIPRPRLRFPIRFSLPACAALWLVLCAAGPAASLPKAALAIGGETLQVEVASTPDSMARGLMFRGSLPENAGMLFVFSPPRRVSFWMRDTSIPLSVAYLDARGVIREIHALVPFDETAVASKTGDIAYAIEANRDWFSSRHIGPGAAVKGLPPQPPALKTSP